MKRKNDNSKNKLNNKGFSLLELILVVAIIAVISGVIVVGISVLGSADSKKMSKALYSDINNLKTKTLTVSGNWYMIVRQDGRYYKFDTYKEIVTYDSDGNVVSKSDELMNTSSGGSRVTIDFYGKTGDQKFEIKGDNYVKIAFRRDNGAFDKVEVYTEGKTNPDFTMGSDSVEGSFILKSPSSSGTYEVNLWYKTGRITTVN